MSGIYIHIPFCKKKCTYCDFHFSTTFSSYRSRMIDSIVKEIRMKRDYLENSSVETIYFGGGTPSLLDADELNAILHEIRNNFNCSTVSEITLEANPDDITESKLADWKNAGINRLSIGIQSLKQKDLDWMNRAHSAEEALKCISLAKKFGFDNLTCDLIYGLPELTMDEWKSHIRFLIEQDVPHISAYCLTVEKNTALRAKVKTGELVPSDEDEQSDQFMELIRMLEDSGYEQYEVSNFCKQGYESVHNSSYWKGNWYLGIGPSAHSFNGVSRSWNIANNQGYMRKLDNDEVCWEIEVLSGNDRFNEMILTGLRTKYGVDLNELEKIMVLNSVTKYKLDEFMSKNWMKREGEIIKLTKNGKLMADYIASELFVISAESKQM